MIITVSGDPGSGKNTFVSILLKKLVEAGKIYNLISMGNLRREFAAKKKWTLAELNEWSTQNPDQGDREFDNYLAEYGKKHDNFIAIARLGWYFLLQSFKVYVAVDSRVGAERIFAQKQTGHARNEVSVGSVEEQMKVNSQRTLQDIARFRELYGIEDFTDPSHYDLVVDSSAMTPDKLADSVFEKIYK